MHLNIRHSTRYAYEKPVAYAIQQLRLTPQDGFGQKVKHWELRVNGKLQPSADAFGNVIHTLVMDKPHEEVIITASGEVETDVEMPAQPDILPLAVYLRHTSLTRAGTAIDALIQHVFNGAQLNHGSLQALMHEIRKRVTYQRGITHTATTAEEALEAGVGVCQDHAHIFIACCRQLGVPARYVSGYLFTESGELVESHAWADAWIDGQWLSYDVSNGVMAKTVHVRLATGLDYRDACPITGIRQGGGNEQMAVLVQMHQNQQ